MAGSAPSIDCAYLVEGDGPPVVLVHASNTDHRIWEEHAKRIGERFCVLAPTQRYFGTSRWPDEGQHFSVDTHAHDLGTFIRNHRVEPVSLVGWSYGAAVCLKMASEQPELVERLILYEPAAASFVRAPQDANAAAADRVAMTALARARVSKGDTVAAVPLFMDGVNGHHGAFDRLPDRVQQIMLENHRTLPLLFAAPPVALTCDNLKPLEGTRTVVARGDATRTFYRIAAEWTAACVPGSTLVVIPEARHLLPVEDEQRFSALVLDLLESPKR